MFVSVQALNDVVIDRGVSNHILSLVIAVDNKFVTKMSGDGALFRSVVVSVNDCVCVCVYWQA